MAYYTPDAGSLKRVRRAAKDHRCDDRGINPDCLGRIKKGDRYTITALPPHSELGNLGWWTMKMCAQCIALPEE